MKYYSERLEIGDYLPCNFSSIPLDSDSLAFNSDTGAFKDTSSSLNLFPFTVNACFIQIHGILEEKTTINTFYQNFFNLFSIYFSFFF